jgi:hypothetical protein
MADANLNILLTLKDQASDALKTFNSQLEDNKKSLGDLSKMAAGAGASIMAAMGFAVNAAEQDREANARLSQSLKNIGVDYDTVKSSIDKVIDSQIRSSGVASEEQANALSTLILYTGDYQKALDTLPLVIDLAASKQMDLKSAADVLGKVMGGNVSILSRYGIAVEDLKKTTTSTTIDTEALSKAQADASIIHQQASISIGKIEESLKKLQPGTLDYQQALLNQAKQIQLVIDADAKVEEAQKGVTKTVESAITAEEALALIQDKVKGTAEATISPFKLLTTNLEELASKIGAMLLPMLQSIVDHIIPIIDKIAIWIEQHPELAKVLTIVIAALGVFLTTIGALGIALPFIISGLTAMGIAFDIATGPIGLVVLAIAAVIAIGVLLATHWKQIVNFLKEHWEWFVAGMLGPIGFVIVAIIKHWDAVKEAFVTSINWIIERVNDFINLLDKIPGINIGNISLIGEKVPEMATGGIVPGPIGQPIPIIAHGGETVTPVGGNGGITNNFNINGMTVRDESDIYKIARKLYVMEQLRV